MSIPDFTIPIKLPDSTCNARMYVGGEELYCPDVPVGPGHTIATGRCLRHDPTLQTKLRQDERAVEAVERERIIEDNAGKILEDKRNLTRLDWLIAKSQATIEELERRNPLALINMEEATIIQKLRLNHAELVKMRVDLELKLRLNLTVTNMLWEEAQDIFEKVIVDENTRKTVEISFGELLTRLQTQER